MPRTPPGRVGRSAGVAEHRVNEHRFASRLSRTTPRTRVVAVACVLAVMVVAMPGAVSAQTATGSIGRTRAAIDATANEWFAAQREVATLDVQIAGLDKTIGSVEHRVDRLRRVADARAVELYESNTQALGGMMSDTATGGDPLELGRRAALIGQANAAGQLAIDQLEAAISDLDRQRHEIDSARAAQTKTLRVLTARRHTLDALLAALELGAAHAEARTELAAALRRQQDAVAAAAATRPPTVDLTSDASDAGPAPAVTIPSPVSPPPATGGPSPHHDEPFLVCTRARESDGDYAAVSPSGLYYGAYQFAPTTWDVTASHVGRLDLVGVLPSRASEFDQDELAWALYEWQGNAPWGGRC